MHAELRDALANLGDARVVVLTGAGRGFCAGQDLNDRAVAPGEAVDLGETVEESWNPLIRTLAALPQPVIARVNGVAAGAGANIALACDIVIAAKSAKFIQSFSALGLIPDSGGSWHLPRLVGQARALGLALTGEPLPAEKAAEWGLIWKAVEDDALDAEVDAVATKLASLPPLGLAAIKQIIRTSWSPNPRPGTRPPARRNAPPRLHRRLSRRRRRLPRKAPRQSSPAADQATSSANLARSILPPETMQTIGPSPAWPVSAAASDNAPAPSEMVRVFSAIRRIAARVWSSETVIAPSTIGLHPLPHALVTLWPPAPSTNDACQSGNLLGPPSRSE